jgi:SAM-dependent methyltransferase
MLDPKERFSDRVADYVRYRPGYPVAVAELLVRIGALGPGRVVADVGSGTGIFSRLLLDAGASVVGVEPNAAMRNAAERALAETDRFRSSDGSAESTGLAASSIDLVTAAQAFHWFRPAPARVEFARILKPGGYSALVWNQRADTPLNRAYEAMLERFAPDYAGVREKDRAAEPVIRAFFAPVDPSFAVFANGQVLDEEGFRGRLASSSYAPRAEHPSFAPMMQELGAIFRAHEVGGKVVVPYDTVVWYGTLS